MVGLPPSGVNHLYFSGQYFILDNKQKVKVNGVVIEALPDTKFRVQLEDGKIILAYLAGKMRLNYIKVMIGDKVEMELSPDGDKGRITFRHKI